MNTEKLIQDQVMEQYQSENSEFQDLSKLKPIAAQAIPDNQNPLLEQEQKAPEIVDPKPSSKEINLRIMRERAEEEERKRIAAERRIAEMEQLLQNQQKPQQKVEHYEDDEEFELLNADDDLVESKDVKKLAKALKKKISKVNEELRNMKQATATSQAEARLAAMYPDASQVLSSENCKNFARLYPDEYETAVSNPDSFKALKTAYNMIKHFGIAEAEETNNRYEQNQQKPRSASSVGSPQTSHESALTRLGDYDRRILSEARKNELRQQVELAKQYR